MNIDTLNAYCSSRPVLLLCLAQGRFNIHQTFFHEEDCIGLSRADSASCLKLLSCVRHLPADSRGTNLSWVGGSSSHLSLEYLFAPANHINLRPEIRQGYPPNLSILISGGKENNCDALSNGE